MNKRAKIVYQKPPESLIQFEIDRRIQFLAQAYANIKNPEFERKHPRFKKGSTYAGKWAPVNKGAKPDPVASRKIGAVKSGAIRNKSQPRVAHLPANPAPNSTSLTDSKKKPDVKGMLKGKFHPAVVEAFENLPFGHEDISKGLSKLAGLKYKYKHNSKVPHLIHNLLLVAHSTNEGHAKPKVSEFRYNPKLYHEGTTGRYNATFDSDDNPNHDLHFSGTVPEEDWNDAGIATYHDSYGQFNHEYFGHGTEHALKKSDKEFWSANYKKALKIELGNKYKEDEHGSYADFDNFDALDMDFKSTGNFFPSTYATSNVSEYRAEMIDAYSRNPKQFAKDYGNHFVKQLEKEGIKFTKGYHEIVGVKGEGLEAMNNLATAFGKTKGKK